MKTKTITARISDRTREFDIIISSKPNASGICEYIDSDVYKYKNELVVLMNANKNNIRDYLKEEGIEPDEMLKKLLED